MEREDFENNFLGEAIRIFGVADDLEEEGLFNNAEELREATNNLIKIFRKIIKYYKK